MLFRYYTKGLKKLRKLDVFEQYEGIIYRLVALKALRDTEKAFDRYSTMNPLKANFGSHIQCLWDVLDLNTAFSPFFAYSGNKKL